MKAAWVSHEALELNLKNDTGFSRRHKGKEPSRQNGRLREHGILGKFSIGTPRAKEAGGEAYSWPDTALTAIY